MSLLLFYLAVYIKYSVDALDFFKLASGSYNGERCVLKRLADAFIYASEVLGGGGETVISALSDLLGGQSR